MNALQLVNELLSRFGLTEVTSFSGTVGADSTVALRKLNIAQQMICTKHPFSWLEYSETGSFASAEGTSTYTLTSPTTAISRFLVANHQYNGGGVIEVVDRITLEQYRPSRSDTTDRGVPRLLATKGKTFSGSTWDWNVELFPIPDSAFGGQTIYYFFLREGSDMSATTDIPIIPIDFHPLLLDQAELLYRTGAVRVGGDQNQVDLFSAVASRVAEGLRGLKAADGSWGSKTQMWDGAQSEI